MTISATTQGLKPGVCTSSNRPANPFDGMMIYETVTNLVRIWNGTAWKTLSYSDYTSGSVIQLTSVTKTDTFTASTTTYTDITGMSASITPTSASSKVFVLVNIQGANNVDVDTATMRLMRDSTAIAIGDAAGSRVVGTAALSGGADPNVMSTNSISFLDSPATTSATTYKIQGRSNQTAAAFFINRSRFDTDGTVAVRGVSTITLMEIAG
jgi:hypothetical protein